ncbi:hypothetical protein AAMO2058_000648900 [Amorphochlora amoebiformis]|uniref:PH domain-containing protein n=1 Tax=Amorphochlora amoebiformis TaxID=1561963 RepID=A0A7S0DNJ5_9EUKA|mmetsp:Transcript_3716/g.5732  ORF Transcript_3716/g.5732 Transcript_3716/m.5732 type:complete len:318 (+) Transcript_3716:124-1077(+)
MSEKDYEKQALVQIMHLFAPLDRSTKDRILEDLQKMRDRNESVGCLPKVYITGIASGLATELDVLRAENKELKAQLKDHGITVDPGGQDDIFSKSNRGDKLKRISSFHALPEIKTPNLMSQTPSNAPGPDLSSLDTKDPSTQSQEVISGQTVTIEVVKHLQQGTGLLKKMRWSAPKIRVFKLSKDMQYLERESLNFLSFEPTRIHLNHITAMESDTRSTVAPDLREAGFCILYDPSGKGSKKNSRFFDVIAPTAADYLLWTRGLQLVLETRAGSKATGSALKAELLSLTIEIPVTMINHWYVQHFPNGCMDDGDDAL